MPSSMMTVSLYNSPLKCPKYENRDILQLQKYSNNKLFIICKRTDENDEIFEITDIIIAITETFTRNQVYLTIRITKLPKIVASYLSLVNQRWEIQN